MKQDHIIHKVTVEVTVSEKEKAYEIKDNINSFLLIDVFPKFEKYINKLQEKLDGQTLQISRMTLDIDGKKGILDAELKRSIAGQFEEQLKEQLKEVAKVTGEKIQGTQDTEDEKPPGLFTHSEKQLRTFLYFLEKGDMPWWNSNEKAVNILESATFKKVTATHGFDSGISALIQKANVRRRMVNQLDDRQLKQLCLAVMAKKSDRIDLEHAVVKQVLKSGSTHRNAFWSMVLNVVAKYVSRSGESQEAFILQEIANAIPHIEISRNSASETFMQILKIFPSVTQRPDIAGTVRHYFPQSNPENDLAPGQAALRNEFMKGGDVAQYKKPETLINTDKMPEDGRPQTAVGTEMQPNAKLPEQDNVRTNDSDKNEKANHTNAVNKLHNESSERQIDAATSPAQNRNQGNETISPQKNIPSTEDTLKRDKLIKQAKSQINTHTDNDFQSDEVKKNGYHVQNAGLILIHPFITNLFRYCDLVEAKTNKLTDAEVCIHLLHYIATGKTNQPESNMLFEKFLCNVPLQQSISRHIKLSRKHKTQAKKVIQAVQENWSAMKTAPPELLQNEFFQRPGKLMLHDSPVLTIERKAQDILLDKLTWGIGLVKLPWQSAFIYANW